MSVWQSDAAGPALCGSEGALVSVCIDVEPRDLEELLDALAHLEFPINPQIYHDAALVRRYADGREASEPATIVEFPAYEERLEEIRGILVAYGFGSGRLHVAEMLNEIHTDCYVEAAPAGADYQARLVRKRVNGRVAAAR